jgi:hypothetical protein
VFFFLQQEDEEAQEDEEDGGYITYIAISNGVAMLIENKDLR